MTLDKATKRLFSAVESGNLGLTKAALAAGGDPTAKDGWQRTPLHYAATAPDHHPAYAIGLVLIDKGADVNARDEHQNTPLHRAAERGRLDLCRLLVEKKAEINARNVRQESPLHIAARQSNIRVARLLTYHHADSTITNAARKTARQIAVDNKATDIINMIDQAARNDPGHVSRLNNRTPVSGSEISRDR
jgi:ankyrin repeat protein